MEDVYLIGMTIGLLLVPLYITVMILLEVIYLADYIISHEEYEDYGTWLSWIEDWSRLPNPIANDLYYNDTPFERYFIMFTGTLPLIGIAVLWPVTAIIIVFCSIVFPIKLLRKKLLEMREDDERRETREGVPYQGKDKATSRETKRSRERKAM